MPDCEAVTLWRKKFSLNLSQSWKADVEKTVTDLKLWEDILNGWFYVERGKKKTKHPGIKGLLDEYERLSFNKRDAIQQSRSGIHSAESLPERAKRILPELKMPILLAGKGGWK